MKTYGIALILAIAFDASLVAQERPAEEAAFAAALDGVRQELQAAPPVNPRDLPKGAIVVAQRTIGGAPAGCRRFVDKFFGTVIAEEMLQSYGENGPAPRTIDQSTAGPFAIVRVEQFENGPYDYDWRRLNQEYPQVRYVMRLSWPVVDSIGTYAVVRYELIGRDRPSTANSQQPWQHASFVKFEKQPDGSWKRTFANIGAIWN